MRKLLLILFLMSQSIYAMADGNSDCKAAAGSYLTGSVVGGPTFARASTYLKGIGLSHTHLKVQSDQDGQVYDVAIDNVYASDYVKNSKSIPRSLSAIQVGDQLEMCGELYSSGLGIHWVHNNCSVAPDATHPNGFIKKVAANGTEGSSLEASQAYCYLWQ